MLRACLVAVLCVWLTHGQTFNPGCSFYNGQCVYSIQMGHAGQCDAGKREAGGSQDGCCTAVQGEVKTLRDDVTRLDAMMADLARALNGTSASLANATSALASVQQERDQLVSRLQQKAAELNTTQAELARIIHQAGEEIQRLRGQVQASRQDLFNCQALMGLNTTATHPALDNKYTLYFCDFEDSRICGFTQDRDDSKDFALKYGGTGYYGPVADHTMGSPSGHYMYILPTENFRYQYSGSTSVTHEPQVMRLTSTSYPPAMAYCIQFWYHMNGTAMGDLKVYAKIGSGRGYPIFSRSGNQGRGWQLGEVQLDSEYTANNFALTFEATSSGYYIHYSSSSSHDEYHDTDSIIAIDDIYAYNTTCDNIPWCPVNAHVRHEGNRSSCYSFHVSPKSWRDAAKACRLLGAQSHLVSVTSQEEQTFLDQVIQADPTLVSAGQYGWYAGATDEGHEGTWQWTDLGTPYSSSYSAWHPGQPNNVASNQNCLLLQYPQDHYAWGDVDCSEQHPYICEVTYSTTST